MKTIEIPFDVGDRLWRIQMENGRWKVVSREEVQQITIQLETDGKQSINYLLSESGQVDQTYVLYQMFLKGEDAYAECDKRNAALPPPAPPVPVMVYGEDDVVIVVI